MIHFDSDYNNGAHPDVIRQLVATNDSHSSSYGSDVWSESARKKIRETTGCPDARVEFLVGGTQTNATMIDSLLATGEGVIAVETGHIAVHEAGAIEISGHKIITLPSHDGKMIASDLQRYMERFMADDSHLHMVQPGLVFITFPTELGTIYSRREIADIQEVCKRFDLKLYVDGARLIYGLQALGNDLDLPYIASHCDAFYIGGTKAGLLCGEAVVIPRGNAPKNLFTSIKRHGALLAKGRLAGVQFDALFTDDLYVRIGRHAIDMAQQLIQIFTAAGYQRWMDSPTNQQFFVIPNDRLAPLRQTIVFENWEPYDDAHTVCRFVTSWTTTKDDLEGLKKALTETMISAR